ncbi:polysaccharide deacetylase family protein [Caulobacter sp.]|uniref:polysaccharide deacetylase family protein n=1 Tax=Caulobacter sp. TaxID=78 RepID=UPI003BABE7AA
MSMPDDYLTYPKRAYGMDQDRYDWRVSADRPRLAWPTGAAVAAMIVVPIEHHPLNPAGKPFKHPGAMVTPYPDLRHYTTRDYGNRVGVYRLLDALKARDLKATFPVNANQLERLKPLIEAILLDGHEIAAYGLSTDHIHWGGLDPADEAGWVDQVRTAFDAADLKPRAWLSPARQQSFATLDLIAKAGFDLCLDWEQDSVPLAMRTVHGPVVALPVSNELDDRTLLIDRRQTEDDWSGQVLEAAACLKAEAPRYGGQVLGFTLTPYVAGQPFRIHAVREILAGLAKDDAWVATASQIADVAARG